MGDFCNHGINYVRLKRIYKRVNGDEEASRELANDSKNCVVTCELLSARKVMARRRLAI